MPLLQSLIVVMEGNLSDVDYLVNGMKSLVERTIVCYQIVFK